MGIIALGEWAIRNGGSSHLILVELRIREKKGKIGQSLYPSIDASIHPFTMRTDAVVLVDDLL